jgi:hypothetical protein
MNRYQFLMLALPYGAIAYGAYREHKANMRGCAPSTYWIAGFVFCNGLLGVALLTSIFALLEAIFTLLGEF